MKAKRDLKRENKERKKGGRQHVCPCSLFSFPCNFMRSMKRTFQKWKSEGANKKERKETRQKIKKEEKNDRWGFSIFTPFYSCHSFVSIDMSDESTSIAAVVIFSPSVIAHLLSLSATVIFSLSRTRRFPTLSPFLASSVHFILIFLPAFALSKGSTSLTGITMCNMTCDMTYSLSPRLSCFHLSCWLAIQRSAVLFFLSLSLIEFFSIFRASTSSPNAFSLSSRQRILTYFTVFVYVSSILVSGFWLRYHFSRFAFLSRCPLSFSFFAVSFLKRSVSLCCVFLAATCHMRPTQHVRTSASKSNSAVFWASR